MRKIIALLLAAMLVLSMGVVAFAEEPAAKIGEKEYTTLAEAIGAVKDGETITLSDGTHTWVAGWKIQNKSVTFEGSENAIIDMTNVATGQNTSGAKLKFNGVTLKFHGTANYKGFQHAAELVYENCNIIGKQAIYAPKAEFNNCVLENKADYSVWTYGGEDVIFTNCEFITGGKAVLVYVEAATVAEIKVSDCEFISDGSIATDKAAIEIGASATGNVSNYDLEINDCEQEGFAANNSISPLWGNKNSMSTEDIAVAIDPEKDEDGNYVGGIFYGEPENISESAPVATTSDGEGFAIGNNSIAELAENATEDTVITVISAGNGNVSVPNGTTVVNGTEEEIKVNGYTVEPGEKVEAEQEIIIPTFTPSTSKPACDHEFDENGVCEECGVKVIGAETKPEQKPTEEVNPNTGAESSVAVATAIAVVALAGAVVSKRK